VLYAAVSVFTCQLLIRTPLVVLVSKQVSTLTFSTMSVVRFLPRLPMLTDTCHAIVNPGSRDQIMED
jgi:hypothetical protein